MNKWFKAGRSVQANGESTTYYDTEDAKYQIESRKRAIPHSGRAGSWMHTSYFLIWDGGEKEFMSLKDAKNYAEKMEVERWTT